MRTLTFAAAMCVTPVLANGLIEHDEYYDDGAFGDLLNNLDIDDDDWDEEDDEDDEESDDDEDEDEDEE